MNDNNLTDEDMIAEIDALIERIEHVVTGKRMDLVATAFVFVIASNCDSYEEAVSYASEMFIKITKGYESMKGDHRTLN